MGHYAENFWQTEFIGTPFGRDCLGLLIKVNDSKAPISQLCNLIGRVVVYTLGPNQSTSPDIRK